MKQFLSMFFRIQRLNSLSYTI